MAEGQVPVRCALFALAPWAVSVASPLYFGMRRNIRCRRRGGAHLRGSVKKSHSATQRAAYSFVALPWI